jgi:hypothetical protein
VSPVVKLSAFSAAVNPPLPPPPPLDGACCCALIIVKLQVTSMTAMANISAIAVSDETRNEEEDEGTFITSDKAVSFYTR